MSTQRIPSLEFGRLLAIIAVILIHAGPFRGEYYSETVHLFSDILNQIARFAVPFFFLMSGYFLCEKLTQTPMKTLKKTALPLLGIWIIWSLIYLILPFRIQVLLNEGYIAERIGYLDYLSQMPLNTLFEGGFVHLWYLPSFVIAITITATLIHMKWTKFLIPLAVILYLWGLSAGSYAPIFEGDTFIFSRNGPFFSLMLFSLGCVLQQRQFKLTTPSALCLLIGGIFLCLAEGFYLSTFDVWMATHDFLIATPMVAVGVFMLLKNNPNWGNLPWLQKLSGQVFGVYLCHFIVLFVFWHFIRTYQINHLIVDLLLTPFTLIFSFVLVAVLERSPFSKILFNKPSKNTLKVQLSTK